MRNITPMKRHVRRAYASVLTMGCLAVLGCLFAPNLAAPVRADALGMISGHVVDAAGKPVSNVAVLLVPIGPGTELERGVLSGRNGFFVFMGLEPGQYAITANDFAHRSTCTIADVESGQARREDVSLSAPLRGEWRDAPGGVYVTMGQSGKVCFPESYSSSFDPQETQDVYRLH